MLMNLKGISGGQWLGLCVFNTGGLRVDPWSGGVKRLQAEQHGQKKRES